MYKYLLKPVLFLLPPETAHHFVLRSFKLLLNLPVIGTLIRQLLKSNDAGLGSLVFDLNFINPVGLAAGFDKDGRYIDVLDSLGFGFIEVGTVTPLPQIGNDKPRLFRLPSDDALINRMGFNNAGVEALVQQLKNIKNKNIIIGGNIGKNKNTSNHDAYKDYNICFDALHPHVDYFVVNVSSPNTPGLRELQEKKPLNKILSELQLRNQALPKAKPVLLKISPDVNSRVLSDILDVVMKNRLSGIIVNNTTVTRTGLSTSHHRLNKIGAGGLSGKPLKKQSDDLIKLVYDKTSGELPIIGVGGIMTGSDAQEKINKGASLVQIYTGLIYQGPGIVRQIKQYLTQQ